MKTLDRLKSKVKISMLKLTAPLLSLFPGFYFPRMERDVGASRSFLIFFFSASGNLGDAAMLYSIISQIRTDFGDVPISVLIHKDSDAGLMESFGVQAVSIQGLFSVFPSRAATLRISRAFGKATDFIVPGADVLDGVYSPGGSYRRLVIAREARRAGLRTGLVGFSFSDRAPTFIRRYFKKIAPMVHIVCRDPASARRLSDAVGRPVESAADLAFLLPRALTCVHPAAKGAEQIIAKWRASGKGVIVFNANSLAIQNSFPEKSLEEAARELARELNVIARELNVALLFLTHDNRPAHSDARFSGAIYQQISDDVESHFVSDTVMPADIKRICGLSDVVITGRMHLGIAGLGAGRPTLITDFQGKVKGLYELFGTPELALDLRTLFDQGRLFGIISEVYRSRERYYAAIEERLPAIYALSRKNLDFIREG